jgi:hypothetical protein
MQIVPSEFLEVRVLWASHHRWLAGESYNQASYNPGLWLMLQGMSQCTGARSIAS